MHLTYIALETPNPCRFKILCETAIHIAVSAQIDVRVTFNGCNVRVTPKTTYAELCEKYCEQLQTETEDV